MFYFPILRSGTLILFNIHMSIYISENIIILDIYIYIYIYAFIFAEVLEFHIIENFIICELYVKRKVDEYMLVMS